MKKQILGIAFVAILFVGMTPSTPLEDDPCVEELKTCLQKMAQFSVPQGKSAYYMHMAIIKKMSPGADVPDTDADVKLIITPSQMHYETQLLSVYKDEQDAFTIVHPQKQIIRTSGGKIPYSNQAVGEVGAMQLTMLSQCTVSSCKSVEQNGKLYKQLILIPNEALKQKVQVKTMSFTYEKKSHSLKKIETRYLPGQAMINEQITIYDTDFNYKGVLPASVKSKVFNSSGKLLSSYKGYKIVDKR